MSSAGSGAPKAEAGRRGFRLEVIAGASVGMAFEGSPGATAGIGRARDNALVLSDPVVSRHHAIIEPAPNGYRVRDIGSLAGVQRRGDPIPAEGVQLADGDEIELGPIVLRFTLRPLPVAKTPPPPPPEPAPQSRRTPLPTPSAGSERAAPSPKQEQRPRQLSRTEVPSTPIESFGSYQIIRSMGLWGDSKLDVALDPRTDAEVEVQRIAVSKLGLFGRRSFLRACGRARALEHPNLRVPTDVGRLGGTAYVVYPHIRGVFAGDLLRDCRRHLTIALATFIGREISRGLAHLQDKLGRGFRPEVIAETVVVSNAGTVLLGPVGVPRLRSEKSEKIESRYLAPEESHGRTGDHRSAIFSLGVVLYELLGREVIDPGQKLALRSIDTVRIDVPSSLTEVVMRTLEIHPEHRFASAVEVDRELTRELEELAPGFGESDVQRWMAEHYPSGAA